MGCAAPAASCCLCTAAPLGQQNPSGGRWVLRSTQASRCADSAAGSVRALHVCRPWLSLLGSLESKGPVPNISSCPLQEKRSHVNIRSQSALESQCLLSLRPRANISSVCASHSAEDRPTATADVWQAESTCPLKARQAEWALGNLISAQCAPWGTAHSGLHSLVPASLCLDNRRAASAELRSLGAVGVTMGVHPALCQEPGCAYGCFIVPWF